MPPRVVLFLRVVACLLTFASPAIAQEKCFEKVWHGAIGKAEITMEFDALLNREGNLGGRYHYGKSLDELILTPVAGRKNVWEEHDAEGKFTGLLSLTCHGSQLTGKWMRPDKSGERTLVATKGLPESYRSRKWVERTIRIDKRVVLDDHKRYELFSVPGITGVQGIKLLGTGPGIAVINQQLFDLFREQLDSALYCRIFGQIMVGPKHGFQEIYVSDVRAYGERLVVIGQYASTACGGIASTGQGARTFRLSDGIEEDVGFWLQEDWAAIPDAIEPTTSAQDADNFQPNALSRFINEHASEDSDECREAVVTRLDGNHIWPGRSGIVVYPESTIRSSAMCAITFVIPYELIWPYLNEVGRRQADMMKQSLPIKQTEQVSLPD